MSTGAECWNKTMVFIRRNRDIFCIETKNPVHVPEQVGFSPPSGGVRLSGGGAHWQQENVTWDPLLCPGLALALALGWAWLQREFQTPY